MARPKRKAARAAPDGRPLHSTTAPRSTRAVCASPTRGRGYPTIASLLAGVGLAVAASGCEPPQCQATRLDEVRVHGDTALTEVGSFQLKDAARELGVGLGVVTHPVSVSMPLAGAMPAVYPYPPEEDAGTSPDAGTPDVTEEVPGTS